MTGDLSGGYRLRHALPVVVRLEAGEYVAVQARLGLHAFGETPADAVVHLREELVAHAQALEAAGERLSPRLAKQREALRRVLASPDPSGLQGV